MSMSIVDVMEIAIEMERKSTNPVTTNNKREAAEVACNSIPIKAE